LLAGILTFTLGGFFERNDASLALDFLGPRHGYALVVRGEKAWDD
jgi:hypothetical protein